MNNLHKLIFLISFFLLLSNIYAYNLENGKTYYYGSILDIGISDLNSVSNIDVTQINYVNISVSSDYETYISYDYNLEEISEIPIQFDKDIASKLRISYIFFDNVDNIIKEEEININLVENLDTSNFYLCSDKDCQKDLLPKNYDFWIDDAIFVSADKIDYEKYNYNIFIQIDQENNNTLLLSEENIVFPYEIFNDVIVGHNYYKIIIEMISKDNEIYLQEIYFRLSNLKEIENRQLVSEITTNNETTTNILQENNNLETASQKEIDTQKAEEIELNKQDTKLDNKWFFVVGFVVFILVIWFLSNLNKPNQNRRIIRKEYEK